MEGHFVGPPTRGIAYESGSLSGITGENGEFRYEEGGTVSFFIGDIRLGGEVKGSDLLSPIDLVDKGSDDHPAVINIARLLQSLDATVGDSVITIPSSVVKEAVVTNEALFSWIQSLDFGDEQSFANLSMDFCNHAGIRLSPAYEIRNVIQMLPLAEAQSTQRFFCGTRVEAALAAKSVSQVRVVFSGSSRSCG